MEDINAQISKMKSRAYNMEAILFDRLDEMHNKIDDYESIIKNMDKKISKLENVISQMKTPIPKKGIKRKAEPDPKPDPNPPIKKSKIGSKRDIQIQRLKNGVSKSTPWKKGMSKYTSITYVPAVKKWLLQSHIFDTKMKYFKNRKDAETLYENIMKDNNIPIEYIIRKNYNAEEDSYDPVVDDEDAEDDNEIIEEEEIEEEDD
jgi:hypothetical protein